MSYPQPPLGMIILSHGSRHCGAAEGVERIARELSAHVGVLHPEHEVHVRAAHLEFNQPDLGEAARELASLGVEEAVVAPLLFTHGYHARVDVPAVVAEAAEASELTLRIAPGLGTGPDIAAVLATRLQADLPEPNPDTHVVLYAVGSSDEDANAAVQRLSVRVQDATGLHTSVVFATSSVAAAGASAPRQWGSAALAQQAALYPHVHVVPLFVTNGLLLDKLTDSFGDIMRTTGTRITASAPLGTLLAPVLAQRFAPVVTAHPITVSAAV